MIGRNDTQIRGRGRPAASATAFTAAICSAVSFSGSPHSPKMSPCCPPTRYASWDDPPTEMGTRPFTGFTSE